MKYLAIKNRKVTLNYEKFEQILLVLKFVLNNQTFSLDFRCRALVLFYRLVGAYKTRLKNRCFITNRSRSIIKFFRLSRISIRLLARSGELPFVKKHSW